jgi:Ca2+-transporting ATPase
MTITLAIGVKEMAKRKAIIRNLSAIEALGSVTLIATDKTGTLTTNKMKVREIYVDGKIYEEPSPPSLSNNPFSKLLLNGVLCSTASLVFVHDHGGYDVLGDPTEGALLYLGQKMGLIPEMVRKEWMIVEEIPFDSVTKRMTVMVKKNPQFYSSSESRLNRDRQARTIMFSKGAPESILEICDSVLLGEKLESLTPSKVKKIEEIMEKWAKKGLRVLAFAYKQLESVKISHSQLKSEKTDSNRFQPSQTWFHLSGNEAPPPWAMSNPNSAGRDRCRLYRSPRAFGGGWVYPGSLRVAENSLHRLGGVGLCLEHGQGGVKSGLS